MSQQLISHIFGTIISLERSISEIESLSAGHPEREKLLSDLAQHGKVLRHMRQVANRLQLEVASNSRNAILRSISIFYGLNQMVRPEIMKSYAQLRNMTISSRVIDERLPRH